MNIKSIKKIVDDYVGFDISIDKRTAECYEARYIFYYLALKYADGLNTYSSIGKMVNRDHATVYNGIKEFYNLYKFTETFKYSSDRLEQEIVKFIPDYSIKFDIFDLEKLQLINKNRGLKTRNNNLRSKNTRLTRKLKKYENKLGCQKR